MYVVYDIYIHIKGFLRSNKSLDTTWSLLDSGNQLGNQNFNEPTFMFQGPKGKSSANERQLLDYKG